MNRALSLFALLVGFLQGTAIYYLLNTIEKFKDISTPQFIWLFIALALVFFIPLSFYLLRDRPKKKVAGALIVLFTALFLMGLSLFKLIDLSNYMEGFKVFSAWSLIFIFPVFWFVYFSILTAMQDSPDKLIPSYKSLVAHSWQNTFIILQSMLFVSLLWLVLVIWAGLFKTVGIDFFEVTFFKIPRNLFIISFGALGFSIVLLRGHPNIVDAIQKPILFVLSWLYPLLSFVVTTFLLTALLKNGEGLYENLSTVVYIMTAMALILLLNAAYLDGEELPPYSKWLRIALRIGIVSLLAISLIAFYGVYLRTSEYGLTPFRVWMLVAVFFLLLYSFGYTLFTKISSETSWFEGLGKINSVAAYLFIACLFLLSTPWFSPMKMSVNSQLNRYSKTSNTLEKKEIIGYLYFKSGIIGKSVFTSLEASAGISEDEKSIFEKVKSADSYYQFIGKNEKSSEVLNLNEKTHPLSEAQKNILLKNVTNDLLVRVFPVEGFAQNRVVFVKNVNLDKEREEKLEFTSSQMKYTQWYVFEKDSLSYKGYEVQGLMHLKKYKDHFKNVNEFEKITIKQGILADYELYIDGLLVAWLSKDSHERH